MYWLGHEQAAMRLAELHEDAQRRRYVRAARRLRRASRARPRKR